MTSPQTAGEGDRRDDVLVGTSEAERFRAWRERAFRRPLQSGLAGCLLLLASAFVGLSVAVATVVAGAGSFTETRLGMLLLAAPGVIAALVAFVVLAPIAHRVHLARERGARGFGNGPILGAVLVLVAVTVLGAVAGKRQWDARVALDGLKQEWTPVRAALLDGDLPTFRRRWDLLTGSIDRTRRGHPRLRAEIDEAVDVMVAEFDVIVSDAWERVARGLDGVASVAELGDAPRLGARPGLRARLREHERAVAERGVRLEVVVEDLGDAEDVAWFDAALDDVARDLLPDRVVVREWPFGGQEPALPTLHVECVLGGVVLGGVGTGARDRDDRELLVPALLVVRMKDADGTLDAALPAEPAVVGPLSLEEVLDALHRRYPDLRAGDVRRWSTDEVQAARDAFRRELTSRLRSDLGLPRPAADGE